MFDLGRLRAIDALARHGTVHAAAAALHCTPSAVSQQLTKLERETGTVLCHKDRRGLPTGQAVATTAGRLPARYVIHTVGPIWHADEDRSELLRACYTHPPAVADPIGEDDFHVGALDLRDPEHWQLKPICSDGA